MEPAVQQANSALVLRIDGPQGVLPRFYGERAVDTWRRRMRRLREFNLIQSKPGPSGDFHFVLLLNPNVAMEWMRVNGMVQDGLYGRFLDRLIEVGGYGELEAIRAYWEQVRVAQAALQVAEAGPGEATSSDAAVTPPAAPGSSVETTNGAGE